MPVVELEWEELTEMTGASRERIEERIPMMGADVERVKPDAIDVEFFPDRPDLFSVEGVARALRGFLGEETGCPTYRTRGASLEMSVEDSVEEVRPLAVGAVIRGVELGERGVKSMMGLQEHLHRGPGRERRRVAIGLHDLAFVEGDLAYRAADPSEASLVPLESEEEMTLEEVAEGHPKGGYASIVEGMDRWPVIEDEEGVISFPPVINSKRTEVTAGTTDLLVESTGTDLESLKECLAVVCAALADRGGELERLRLTGAMDLETPDMEPEVRSLEPEYVREVLGLEVSDSGIAEALEGSRIGAQEVSDELMVKVPAYRSDVLHPRDLVEEVAIGFGYDEFEPEFPDTPGVGGVHELEERGDLLREVLSGMGFLEVMTLTLGNEDRDYRDLRREPDPRRAVLENPISEDHTMVRTHLLPSLLEILSHNRHRDLPQRIFEYGEVVREGESLYRLGALTIGEEADFTEARAAVDGLLNEVPGEFEVERSDDPALLEGRRGRILRDGEKVGVFGTLHPAVLESFGLQYPVAVVEADAELLTARSL